eukprot:6491693-Amphidinium_carterae.2
MSSGECQFLVRFFWGGGRRTVVFAGALQRKAQYEEVRADKGNPASFMACLDHHPKFGPGGGSLFPTLLTHNSIWSWAADRLATGLECLTAQGLDFYGPLIGSRGVSPLKPLFEKLEDKEQRSLAGNAMHLPLFSLWIVYVLGNTRRVTDGKFNLSPSMPGKFNASPSMPGKFNSSPSMPGSSESAAVGAGLAAGLGSIEETETKDSSKEIGDSEASQESCVTAATLECARDVCVAAPKKCRKLPAAIAERSKRRKSVAKRPSAQF